MNDYMITVDKNGSPYIAHYGIKGQKWGYRRFQNTDGSWTEEGKRRYGSGNSGIKDMKKEVRKEYKKDNKEAYELGKKATINEQALDIAKKKTARAEKAFQKKPSERRQKRLEAAKSNERIISEMAKVSKKEIQNHHKKLIEKYGKEAVSNIKYDKYGRVSEKTHTGKEIAAAVGVDAAAITVGALTRTPIVPIIAPTSKRLAGYDLYNKVNTVNSAAKKYASLSGGKSK